MSTDGSVYDRAGRLFDQLVETPESVREASLVRATAADPEAVAMARRMLAAEPPVAPGSTDGLADVPGGTVPDQAAAGDGSRGADPAGPRTVMAPPDIDGLHIIRQLGSGGMGSVWLAETTDDPPMRLAVKLLTTLDVEAQMRFDGEALALQRLDHPGIVAYRGRGRDARDRAYLLMDYVDGEPLGPTIPEIAASVDTTVRLMIEVAEAVDFAHGRGIIHRDLKRENVLVRRTGDRIQSVVIDFGVARGVRGSEMAGAIHSLGVGIVGSWSTMSPEQLRIGPSARQDDAGAAPAPAEGSPITSDPHVADARSSEDPSTDITTRSDVYALGSVLYELLSGRSPLGLGAGSALDLATIVERIVHERPVPPSRVVDEAVLPADRARRIDADLDAIVGRALEKAPGDRYASARDFARDLERWRAGEPVEAVSETRLRRVWRTVRRHPALTATIAVTTVLLAGFGVRTELALRSEREANRRTLGALAAEAAAKSTARDVNRFFLDDVFLAASPDRQGPGTSILEVLHLAGPRLDARFADDPETEVRIRSTLARIFVTLEDVSAAEAHVASATERLADVDADDPLHHRVAVYAGQLCAANAEWDAARAQLEGAIDGLSAAGVSELDDDLVDARITLATVELGEGRLVEARRGFEAILGRLDPSHGLPWQSADLTLGYLLFDMGDRDEGIARLERGLEITAEAYGDRHHMVMEYAATLAACYLNLNRADAALDHARLAADVAVATLPDVNRTRLVVMNNYASVLSKMGRFEESIPLRRENVAGRRIAFGPDAGQTIRAELNLATTLCRAGRPLDALELVPPLRQRTVGAFGEASLEAASVVATEGVARQQLGQLERARIAFTLAIDMVSRATGDHTRLIGDWNRTLREIEAALAEASSVG